MKINQILTNLGAYKKQSNKKNISISRQDQNSGWFSTNSNDFGKLPNAACDVCVQPSGEPCLWVDSQDHEKQELLPQVQLQVLLVWLLQPSGLEGDAASLINYQFSFEHQHHF